MPSRDIEGIIRRTLEEARMKGRDSLSAWHSATRAVLSVRPDMTFSQAFLIVHKGLDQPHT